MSRSLFFAIVLRLSYALVCYFEVVFAGWFPMGFVPFLSVSVLFSCVAWSRSVLIRIWFSCFAMRVISGILCIITCFICLLCLCAWVMRFCLSCAFLLFHILRIAMFLCSFYILLGPGWVFGVCYVFLDKSFFVYLWALSGLVYIACRGFVPGICVVRDECPFVVSREKSFDVIRMGGFFLRAFLFPLFLHSSVFGRW